MSAGQCPRFPLETPRESEQWQELPVCDRLGQEGVWHGWKELLKLHLVAWQQGLRQLARKMHFAVQRTLLLGLEEADLEEASDPEWEAETGPARHSAHGAWLAESSWSLSCRGDSPKARLSHFQQARALQPRADLFVEPTL